MIRLSASQLVPLNHNATQRLLHCRRSCWLSFWCSGTPVLVGPQVTLLHSCAVGRNGYSLVVRLRAGQGQPHVWDIHGQPSPAHHLEARELKHTCCRQLDHKSPMIWKICPLICCPLHALLPLHRHDVKIFWMQSWAATLLQHLGPALGTICGPGCQLVYACWQQTWCQVSFSILYMSNPLQVKLTCAPPPEGNATEFGSRMMLYSQNSTSSSCMQGAMLWATTQTSVPASTIANVAVMASSSSQTTAGIVAAALSSVQGANVTTNDVSLLLTTGISNSV